MTTSAYIAFLKARHELDVQTLFGMPADERELLEIAAVCASQGKPLTVSQFMALTHLASPATLHRKLTLLLEARMILLTYEGKNRRTKFIHPSGLAIDYFQRAGAALAAVKEAA